jgi:hypothetical protein
MLPMAVGQVTLLHNHTTIKHTIDGADRKETSKDSPKSNSGTVA